MHPNRAASKESHNDKLRRMTMDYGSASGPANNKLAPPNRLKGEGGEEHVGFGADSFAAKARGDKPGRRSVAANPVSTYAKGGRVKHKASGGDVSDIEAANVQQAEAAKGRARGGRTNKGKGATHVNVIVAPQGGHGMGGMGIPPGGPMPGGPMPPPLPPGAGAPPGMPPGMPPGGPAMAGGRPMMPPGAVPPGMMPPRKRGGRIEHSDEAADKSLVKKMVKGSALKHRDDGGPVNQQMSTAAQPSKNQNDMYNAPKKADGGRVGTLADQGLTTSKKEVKFPVERAKGGVIHMTAGAATGEGRLEKIGKKAHNAGRPQTV